MKALFTGIYYFFKNITNDKNNEFYDSVNGFFRYGEAKEEWKNCDYAVYFMLDSINEDTFTETITQVPWQINCYSKFSGNAQEIMEKAGDLFDGKTLSISGYKDITFNRNLIIPAWKDNDLWCASIEFEGLIQKEKN